MTDEERYRDLLGAVPETIEQRRRVAAKADFPQSLEAIEAWRKVLLHDNPLPRREQQLVHFALVLGAGEDYPAELHAAAALRAGASAADLYGVCCTAAVTAGMPAFTRGVRILDELLGSG